MILMVVAVAAIAATQPVKTAESMVRRENVGSWLYSEAAADALVQTFFDACFDGQARFEHGQVSAIDYQELPRPLRNWYDRRRSALYYKVHRPTTGYLISYDRPYASGAEYRKVCAIAAQSQSPAYIYFRIGTRMGFKPARDSSRSDSGKGVFSGNFKHENFEYEASVNTVGPRSDDFTVMQVSFFNKYDQISRKKESARLLARHLRKSDLLQKGVN